VVSESCEAAKATGLRSAIDPLNPGQYWTPVAGQSWTPVNTVALRAWIEREKLTQAQALKRLGITQPRVSEITRGKVGLLSLDYLAGLCAKTGIAVGLKIATSRSRREGARVTGQVRCRKIPTDSAGHGCIVDHRSPSSAGSASFRRRRGREQTS
jgi:transcriptional regulator with XRE-family HTH domain